ncbi:MAG TPA: extracellular solute-binding protein, partial [Chloroflexota bacterium]
MRKLFIAVNVLVAMLMIGAVTLVGRNGASAAPSYAGSVSFGTWSSNPTEQAGQKKLVQAFENKYHINVNFQVLNGDYSTVLKARLTAGTAPDVFYLNSTDAQSFIRTGALANLDFLAKDKSFGFSEFYNSLQFGFKWKGHTYAMAKDYSPLALWYNKTLFAKAGISKPPTTWAQITADACKLTDKAN